MKILSIFSFCLIIKLKNLTNLTNLQSFLNFLFCSCKKNGQKTFLKFYIFIIFWLLEMTKKQPLCCLPLCCDVWLDMFKLFGQMYHNRPLSLLPPVGWRFKSAIYSLEQWNNSPWGLPCLILKRSKLCMHNLLYLFIQKHKCSSK